MLGCGPHGPPAEQREGSKTPLKDLQQLSEPNIR